MTNNSKNDQKASNWISENSEEFSESTVKGLLALAKQMERSDTTINSPIREVFSLLGDK
jgi:hypothetical protein